MLVQVTSLMLRRNRLNSGSSNIMILPKKLCWTATESRQESPLIGLTAPKAVCARLRQVPLRLATNTYNQISESSRTRNGSTFPHGLIRLAVALAMAAGGVVLLISAPHARAGFTNSTTLIP